MKTRIFNSGTLILLLLCIAISATSQSDDQLKEKIVKINKEISKAMLEGNSQVTLGYYAADAISMPNNAKMVQGIEAIKKSNEEMMSSGFKVNSFELNTVMVKEVENMVTEIGNYKMSFSMPGMPEASQDAGKYINIWEKQADGSLKIKVEMWNTDLNPMAQQQ
jgi:ketosteroid isomerase-like protein